MIRNSMKKCSATALMLLALGWIGPVWPQEQWYAGMSIGNGNVSLDPVIVAASPPSPGTVSGDKRDPAFRVLLGYRFNSWLAVEGGYAYLGEFRKTRTLGGNNALNADLRIKALFVDAVVAVPITTRLDAVGRLGLGMSEISTFRSSSGTATFSSGSVGSAFADEFNAKIGIGARYALGPRIALRAEWERYLGLGNESTGETDVDAYLVGLEFRP